MVLQPKPVDYPRIRRALSIYKVTSVITGVMLLLLCAVMVMKYVFGVQLFLFTPDGFAKFEPLAPYLPADSVIVSSSETAVFTAMLSRVYGRTPDSQENMAANLKRALGKEPNVKRDVSISVTRI